MSPASDHGTRAPAGRFAVSGSPPSIDVVLVVYERWDLTESCLRHLAEQTVPHRLIVVDNGSTDSTADNITKRFPQATLIRFDRNMPYATACNRGAKAADGEVIVILNNDVDCRPDFLERLTAPVQEDGSLGAVSGLLLQPGEKLIDSLGLAADRTLAAFPRFHGRPVSEAHPSEPTLTGPAGAAAAYRRSAWEEVGGLDEEVFAYMEDFELALRLRAAGWKALAVMDAVAIHIGSATHGRRSAWQRRHGGFGRGYVLRRYGVLRTGAGLRALVTELIVVLGDAVISRDVAALRGRVAGWRAAARKPRLPFPPAEAIANEISLADSIRLRREAYSDTAT
jgi:N-acetylglucosaminyl-diphospho-decaprenol L-rhamnosyltransferase